MSASHPNAYPKLHNAAWPGVVGKGGDAEPPIALDTMLDLTAAAEVDGVKFDGVDVFLFAPHVDIDATDADLAKLAEKVKSRGLVVGSVVAPVWPPTGGGSAMGDAAERKKFLAQVRKGCRIAKALRDLGVRPYGVVRIDSAGGVADWAKDPEGNTRQIAETFRAACDIAEEHGRGGSELSDELNENLYRTVDELELSVRSMNCLQKASIKFIGELVQKSEAEMLKQKNFGRKSLKEIKDILQKMGLRLGMKLDGFDPSQRAAKKKAEY